MQEYISANQSERLRRRLPQDHPLQENITSDFNTVQVNESILNKGVFCSQCFIKMTHSKHNCEVCEFPTIQSKIDSIIDFFILLKRPLCNYDIRNLLEIDKHEKVSYILRHANFNKTHGKKYVLMQ